MYYSLYYLETQKMDKAKHIETFNSQVVRFFAWPFSNKTLKSFTSAVTSD